MSDADAAAHEAIAGGRAALGIELGSTRIKACLVGDDVTNVLGTGTFEWENQLVDGVWTYSLDAVENGLRAAYADLATRLAERYGVVPENLRAIGVSAMMHGYLAVDETGELLVPFRTWRNTSTGAASAELSALFGVNIPLRWSIAHLHQAVLDAEPHVPRIRSLTTLAGLVHERLTGRRVLGVGDASGMFPIDPATRDYDATLLERYDDLVRGGGLSGPLRELLPEVLVAGRPAGTLSEAGARFLDPTGSLLPGAVLCPPEGDAGTGMVATDAVAPRTGNVSAGTSVFAMVVLEGPLGRPHEELDVVTTPAGDPVAMVHCNNGASELAAWAGVFREFAAASGSRGDADAVFGTLFRAALEGEPDAGGILAYNHLAGEPIAGLDAGRPLVVRTPESRLTLGNLFRAHLYGVFGTLAIGMRVLEGEGVRLDRMNAHGGIFRTEGVAQRMLAAALGVPVAVAASAGEGGAWGAAVLAAFAADASVEADAASADASVEDRGTDLAGWLRERVFTGDAAAPVGPDRVDAAGFAAFLDRYRAGLAVERTAITAL
ncbi:MAG: ATPase [Micrococcales bacterium]|nr:ATPase [Micrococcales bacterium]